MAQYWQLFNVTLREYQVHNGLAKFAEFFFYKQGFFVRSLTIPHVHPELEKHLRTLENKPAVMPRKGLLALPSEILKKIVEDDAVDIVAVGVLAVTCRRLYAICADYIQEFTKDSSARWAFRRVVCLGDYARYDDLPEGLLIDAERAIIQQKVEENDTDAYSSAGLWRLNPKPCTLSRGAFIIWEDLDYFLRRKFSSTDEKAFKMVMGITFPPERKDWVLCNNVKKEFVRASEIARFCGRPDSMQPFLPHCKVDLGHALLARICWSSVPDGPPPETNIHRGTWAGDRFCIITMDQMCRTEGEPEWKDVSQDVVKDLIAIWKDQYGRNWRSEVRGNVDPHDYPEFFWYASDGDDALAKVGRSVSQREFVL